MSQFQATKCDECWRIQGESNHWIQMSVWSKPDQDAAIGIAMGLMALGGVMAVSDYTSAKRELHDLCGQGCAMKHIAKLLKWSLPAES